ncbi:hypothetical protein niasHT_001191 [Heterodera trifolii]|uniref:Uncharacterized protein n=1 Tax=Heterodera trifolii TaxID=157864 RepID=A0ABD2MC52_9BILA
MGAQVVPKWLGLSMKIWHRQLMMNSTNWLRRKDNNDEDAENDNNQQPNDGANGGGGGTTDGASSSSSTSAVVERGPKTAKFLSFFEQFTLCTMFRIFGRFVGTYPIAF